MRSILKSRYTIDATYRTQVLYLPAATYAGGKRALRVFTHHALSLSGAIRSRDYAAK